MEQNTTAAAQVNHTEQTPRVYITTQKDYTAFISDPAGQEMPVGQWVELAGQSEAEELREAIAEALAFFYGNEKPAAYFYKWEGIPAQMLKADDTAPSDESLDSILQYVAAVEMINNKDRQAFEEWMANEHYNGSADTDDFKSAFQGNYSTMSAFAYQLAYNNGWIPAMQDARINTSYFDSEAYANDLQQSGDYWISETGNVFASY